MASCHLVTNDEQRMVFPINMYSATKSLATYVTRLTQSKNPEIL